jgi:HK97 gp10 family phage protein
MRMRVSWTGLEELETRIAALTGVVAGERIVDALRPGAELIAERWRGKVPKPGPDHPYSTGLYSESIYVEEPDVSDAGISELFIYTDAVNENTGFDYPSALEYGTSRMAAQPSALPAFDESLDEVIDITVERLDALIAEALAR